MPGWKQRVYALAPWKVKECLVAAEAMRLNRYRRYGDYEAIRREYAFSRYQELSQEGLRQWQLDRLRSLVSYARQHCPFYRDRLPERVESLDDLRLIPVLRKADVREHADAILAQGFPRSELWPDQTSGTTGSPLHFFIGREGVRIRFAVMDEYFAFFGCRYGDRRVSLGGQWTIPVSRTIPPFWVLGLQPSEQPIAHVGLSPGQEHDPLLHSGAEPIPAGLSVWLSPRSLSSGPLSLRAWRSCLPASCHLHGC